MTKINFIEEGKNYEDFVLLVGQVFELNGELYVFVSIGDNTFDLINLATGLGVFDNELNNVSLFCTGSRPKDWEGGIKHKMESGLLTPIEKVEITYTK